MWFSKYNRRKGFDQESLGSISQFFNYQGFCTRIRLLARESGYTIVVAHNTIIPSIFAGELIPLGHYLAGCVSDESDYAFFFGSFFSFYVVVCF